MFCAFLLKFSTGECVVTNLRNLWFKLAQSNRRLKELHTYKGGRNKACPYV